VKLFFATLDKNHDGEITIEEVANMIRERQKQGQPTGRRGLGLGRPRNANAEGQQKPAEKKPADAKDKEQAAVK